MKKGTATVCPRIVRRAIVFIAPHRKPGAYHTGVALTRIACTVPTMRCALPVFLLGLAFGLSPLRGAPPVPGVNFTLTESADLTLIWIEPGTFYLSDPLGAGDDTWVTLSRGYWIGRTEVTQAQWTAVLAHHPVYQNDPRPSRAKGADRPVEQITWEMSAIFCTALNLHERAAGRLPEGYEYTLPTEAQWEYAARAGTTGKYIGDLEATTWYEANSGLITHPVAQKQPNAWGLYDMQGNVAEWCRDWYAPYPGGHVVDPGGPASGIYRIVRGGSMVSNAGQSRVAQRPRGVTFQKNRTLGFRLALAPVQATPPSAPVTLPPTP